MRILVLLLIAFAPLKDSGAQVVYSFVPNPATTEDAVRLRIDIFKCFDHMLVTSVDANAGTVTVRFDGDDDLCDDTVPANLVTPRFIDIGQLPVGVYEARVVGCIVFTEQCQTVHSEQLVVSQVGGTRATVPALSLGSVLALVVTALALGGRAIFRT